MLSIASQLRDIIEFIKVIFEYLKTTWLNILAFVSALPHFIAYLWTAYALIPSLLMGVAAAYLSARIILRLINYN